MAAVAGIMGQELLGVQPVWYNAGLKDYPIPPLPLTAIEFLVLGFLELKRFQGFKKHKTVSSSFLDAGDLAIPPSKQQDANLPAKISASSFGSKWYLSFHLAKLSTQDLFLSLMPLGSSSCSYSGISRCF